jgi:hypothetical protein
MKKLFFICILLAAPLQAAIDMWKLFTLPERIIKPIITKMVEQFSSNTNKQQSLSLDINFEKPIEEPKTQFRKMFKDPLTLAQQ